jgi:hypothetical protein
MHSGLCKFDQELGYQFCCWIVLNDEPEVLAGGFKQLTYSEGFPAGKALRKGME